MIFLLLGFHGPELTLLLLVSSVISWIIFYHTIKSAVKNGMQEAQTPSDVKHADINQSHKLPVTEKEKLQDKYDKGQISFDEYHAEWKKLN